MLILHTLTGNKKISKAVIAPAEGIADRLAMW
jgi:hypothetical protein